MSGIQLSDAHRLSTIPLPDDGARLMHVYNYHQKTNLVRNVNVDASIVRVGATNLLGVSKEDLGMLRNYVFTPKTPFEEISRTILFYEHLPSCLDLVSGPGGTEELFLRAVVADVDRTGHSRKEYKTDQQLLLRLSLKTLMEIKTAFNGGNTYTKEDNADMDAIAAYLAKVPDKTAVGELDFSKRKPVDAFEDGAEYRVSPVTVDANGKNPTFETGFAENATPLKINTHGEKPPTKEERKKRDRVEDEHMQQEKQAVARVVESVQYTKFGVALTFKGRFDFSQMHHHDLDGEQGLFLPYEGLARDGGA